MKKEQEMKKSIQSVIRILMERVMNKVLIEDPFVKEEDTELKNHSMQL